MSRKHPLGKAFYNALERGMAELEAKGVAQQAYVNAVSFTPVLRNVKLLTPTSDTRSPASKH